MKFYISLALVPLIAAQLQANEPSAFGAGDLNSKTPYGLTQEEKEILHNRKKLEELRRHSAEQNDQAETLQERIDGMQSILESMLQNYQRSRREFENFKQSIDGLTAENEELFKQLEAYSLKFNENSDGIKQLHETLLATTHSLENNLSLYVTKSEFNTLVNDVNGLRSDILKQFEKINSSKTLKQTKRSDKFASKTLAQVEQQAKADYKRKYYTNAIEAYEYLIKKQYKPARAHYMIAQMLFYRKKYADALSYYKKSAELYTKAKYMPTLMLNAAYCMHQGGDTANAIAFYKALVEKYPGSSEAKTAKKRLNSIR